MPTNDIPADVLARVEDLCTRLDRRATACRRLALYVDGESPLPDAIVRANVTKAYRMLMPISEAPWASLVVGSTQDRLELSGIRTGDKAVDQMAWGWWQDNQMDAESDIAHEATLVDGRSHAMVWPTKDGMPRISLDNAGTTIVQYEEGSRTDTVAALRRWIGTDAKPYATLYLPDSIYKLVGPKDTKGGGGTQWERRQPDGEDWPASNPFGVVPVVEIPINRKLRPGRFPPARGEFAHCTGLLDRINLLTFLGLVVAFYMGFPLRGTIGQKIIREVMVDDNGEPIIDVATGKPKEQAVPPFDANASGLFQLEDPGAKTAEFAAADRKNLSVFAELDQLATITDTPRHYFPMEGGMHNLAADAIRASEGALHAKVTGYKKTLGQGWLRVHQLGGIMGGYEVPARSEIAWKQHESRSLAEQADAASKLKDVLPFAALAELALNATQEQITQWTTQRASDSLATLVEAAKQPLPTPAPVPSGNGAG